MNCAVPADIIQFPYYLAGFYQPLYYESVKHITAGGSENPTQMGQAHQTITYPPAVSGKPGELVAGSTGVAASDDLFEAADVESDAMRIGEGVPM